MFQSSDLIRTFICRDVVALALSISIYFTSSFSFSCARTIYEPLSEPSTSIIADFVFRQLYNFNWLYLLFSLFSFVFFFLYQSTPRLLLSILIDSRFENWIGSSYMPNISVVLCIYILEYTGPGPCDERVSGYILFGRMIIKENFLFMPIMHVEPKWCIQMNWNISW